MTEQNDDYNVLNSLDATTDLKDIIEHFYDDHKNRYKYNNAYQLYRNNIINKTFTPSKKIYDIIAATSLVEDKHVFIDKSQRSHLYHIRKKYLANIDRDKRRMRRDEATNTITKIQDTPITTEQPTTAYTPTNNRYGSLNTQGDEDSDIITLGTSDKDQNTEKGGIMDDAVEIEDTNTDAVEDIPKSILELSTNFESVADTNLKQFQNDVELHDQTNMKKYIDSVISDAIAEMHRKNEEHLQDILQKINPETIEATYSSIKRIEHDCKDRSEKMNNRIFYATTKIQKFETQFESYTEKANKFFVTAQEKLQELSTTTPPALDTQMKKIHTRIDNVNQKMDDTKIHLMDEMKSMKETWTSNMTTIKSFITNKLKKQDENPTDTPKKDTSELKTLTRNLKTIYGQHQRRIEKLKTISDDIMDELDERAATLYTEMKESISTYWQNQSKHSQQRRSIARKKLFPTSSDMDRDTKPPHVQHFDIT